MFQITNKQLNYNPSFRQVNLVRIKKSAFRHPEDFRNCEDIVNSIISNIKEVPVISDFRSLIMSILITLKLKKTDNCFTIINGGKDGLVNFTKPSYGYHTFAVLTGDDKEYITKKLETKIKEYLTMVMSEIKEFNIGNL